MKVIWFNGNFGNQIFYCAYKDYLQANYPKEKIYVLRLCRHATMKVISNTKER